MPEETLDSEATEVVDESEEEIIPFRYSITSYGADYPVDSLVKRISKGSIYIPDFQRGFVWNIKKASKFVESLLLGLPVPGIFLSRDPDQKLVVIDGQQRLRTLEYYYRGVFEPDGKEFSLTGVHEQFEGVTYRQLSAEERLVLDDAILHATIIKQDEPDDGNSSVYQIFERLNTGGMPLQSQEIRAALFHGEFHKLLGELNQDLNWRSLYGKIDKRMRDQELILRFIALLFDSENYTKPMKAFLNSYMDRNKDLKLQQAAQITPIFTTTFEVINNCIGEHAFKPKRAIRAAFFDAIAVGVARRLSQGPIYDCEGLLQSYEALANDANFTDATEQGTSDEASVRTRLQLATEAFSEVR